MILSRRFSMALALAAPLAISIPGSVNAASADSNWAQWRGPLANGVAPSGKPPTKWTETSNVKWKVKIPGNGASTPIIWNDQVFIQTAINTSKGPADANDGATRAVPVPNVAGLPQAPQEPGAAAPSGGRRRGGGGMRSEKPTEVHRFVIMALDRSSGRVLWQKAAREEVPHEGHHRDHGYSSSSPVTDGEHVYAYFGSRGLHCYDLKGNLKWQKDLGRMATRNSFGEGSSPALHGDTLVINWDHEGEDFIVAFDKKTGRELWRNKRDELTTWTTPLVVKHGSRTEVVVPATAKIRSYDLATGKELWSCGGMTGNVIPMAVSDFGMVYCISGFRGAALLAIKLGQSGDLTGTEAIAWQHNKGTPYVPSPLLAGERLYFLSGNNGMLSCFNAKTGQPLFETARLDALSGVYASPVAAAGRVYVVGRNGAVVVLKQSDALEILATNTLEEKFDASPAIVGNQLFLRGHESLYCLAE